MQSILGPAIVDLSDARALNPWIGGSPMSFDDLPPLPPQVNPDAQAYIDRVCALSRAAYKTAHGEFDIPYGHDYWQKIDVFAPPAIGQQKLPVLCFMHGGAWVSGSKEWMAFMAAPITALPSILVS